MNLRHLPILIALLGGVSSPAFAQAVPEFSLPPAPTPTPSASPQVQGPVDTESGVLPVVPRAIETATPGPTPQPTSTPTDQDAAEPEPITTSRPVPAVTTQAPALDRGESPAAATPDVPEPASGLNTEGEGAVSAASPTIPPLDVASADVPAGHTEDVVPDWWWIAALAALAALLAGFAMARRILSRRKAAPMIERPVVANVSPEPPAKVSNALAVRVEVEKLTRSAVFATLKYSITLVNRTSSAFNDVTVAADLVSASSDIPMEEQIATSSAVLEPRHNLKRIAPSQSVTVDGQIQLALAQAKVIRQGRHPLLVPLLRLRVDGVTDEPLVKTYVIGQGQADGGRVQPFRLDEPPRSYSLLGHRELA